MSIINNISKYGTAGTMAGAIGSGAGQIVKKLDAADGQTSVGGTAASTALSYAGMGASLGAIGGPVGMAIGGVAGGIFGGIMGLVKGKQDQKQQSIDTFTASKNSKPIPNANETISSQYGVGETNTYLGEKFGLESNAGSGGGILQILQTG